MVHSQGVTQVTNQVSLTVAIDVLLEVQETLWSSASLGVIVAVSCSVCQAYVKTSLALFKVIQVTRTGRNI